jgi:eukaryotic-like serine/threonine-protein kinase
MSEKHFYDFDRFRIDAGERVLLRDGEIVPMTQKAFDVLFLLVERRDRIVTKEELMNEVWPDAFVEEGNLSQNIYTLRKMLGETAQGDDYIKTVPRRGYRFAAPVNETWEGENARNIPTGELRLMVDQKREKLRDLFELSKEVSVAENVSRDLFVEEIVIEPPAKVEAEPVDRSASPIAWRKPRRSAMAIGAAALLIVILGIAGWLVFHSTGSPEPFSQISIANLTNTGNISSVAISPDGKYVAYGVMDSPQRSSLWITQLGASTSRQIIPPAELQYFLLTFTPDGKYIYYITRTDRTLYRVPLLGGPPKKLLERAERGVSFSPDGSQFVFLRHLLDRRQVGMFVANADGSDVKEIAAIDYPEGFEYPAWLPDGQWIACAAGHSWGGKNMYVVAMRVGEWKSRPISAQKWRWIGQVGWLADSRGFLMLASEDASEPRQVWHLSYPGGTARRITNDSVPYHRMSVSSDARSLVALKQSRVTNVWLIPAEDMSRARQITFGAGGYRGRLSWTPEGRIVYDGEVGEATTISIMDPDGSTPSNLLGDLTGRVTAGLGTVTPDGRYIVYYSDLKGGVRHIWRMNIDGGNPIQLTDGEGENHPTCSPDGRWVIYTRLETKGTERPTLWKVSIDGGAPVQLTNEYTTHPSVSPDGKLIACIYSEAGKWEGRLAVFPFEGGSPVNSFPQPPGNDGYIAWTPDGRSLLYAENPDNDASGLWVQPLDGGPPRQLARFENDRIFGFDWSRDGKQLACVRGLSAWNMVLIKDSR